MRVLCELYPDTMIMLMKEGINDNYDSLKGKNQADEIIIPFKNLINDAYRRDISIKIRSNLEIKRKKGECVTPFVAFGYRKTKTDKHKLEIDPSADSVVQDIFKMKLRGMSQDAIANRLNELGILSPFEYKISSGSRYETGFRQKEQALWSSVTVRRILENEVYIGNLVQGKRTTPNHKVKQHIQNILHLKRVLEFIGTVPFQEINMKKLRTGWRRKSRRQNAVRSYG